MTEINGKRQTNIDLVKCAAIVFMISIHVLMIYVDDLSSGFNYVVNSILGGPLAAPVFMFSMGVGFAYSRSARPARLLRRGINILVLGYILNVLIAPMHFDHPSVPGASLDGGELLASFFYGDILQFAGLAMIAFALLKRLNCSDSVILAVGAALSAVSSLVPVVVTDSYLTMAVYGLFAPLTLLGEPLMCFPFSAWFIFPAMGFWFGNRLRRIRDLDRFYLLVGTVCLPAAVVGIGLEAWNKTFMMALGDVGFYLMCTHDALLSVCAALAMYALGHFAVKVLPDRVNRAITAIGSSLNVIYMLSWVLIVYTQLVLYFFVDSVTGLPLHLLMLGTSLVSMGLGVVLKGAIRARLAKKPRSPVRYVDA